MGTDLHHPEGVSWNYVGQEAATRRFVEAVLWMARAGCAWRLVPGAVGSWNSVYKRFARWQEKGVSAAPMDQLAADADLDGRCSQHRGAGPRLCRRGKKIQGEQALGRSRGGFSNKLHGLADGLGNPLAFRLTAGQQGDAPQALPLLDRLATTAVIADKAYDTDAILQAVAAGGALAVIPPKPPAATNARPTGISTGSGTRSRTCSAHEALPPRLRPLRETGAPLSRLRPSRRRLHPAAVECQQNLDPVEKFSLSSLSSCQITRDASRQFQTEALPRGAAPGAAEREGVRYLSFGRCEYISRTCSITEPIATRAPAGKRT